MTSSDITAIRAQACRLVAATGYLLDSIQGLEEIAAAPGEPALDLLANRLQRADLAEASGNILCAAQDLGTLVDRSLVPNASQHAA